MPPGRSSCTAVTFTASEKSRFSRTSLDVVAWFEYEPLALYEFCQPHQCWLPWLAPCDQIEDAELSLETLVRVLVVILLLKRTMTSFT